MLSGSKRKSKMEDAGAKGKKDQETYGYRMGHVMILHIDIA